jgi:heat shock protein HslJ
MAKKRDPIDIVRWLSAVVAIAPLGVAVAAGPAGSGGRAAGLAPISAEALQVNKGLLQTRWTLVTLDNEDVPQAAGIELVLRSSPQKLVGRAGCKPLSGRYRQRGTRLVLTPDRIDTPDTCRFGRAQEAFLAALVQVDGYRIEDDRLSLLQGDKVSAEFNATTR